MLCKTLSELYSKLGNGKWRNKGFKYFVTYNEFKYGKCYGDEKKLLLFPDTDLLDKNYIVTPLGCHWMTLETDNWEELPDRAEGQIDKIDDQIKDIDDFIAYLKKGHILNDTMSHPAKNLWGYVYFDGFTEEELKTVCGDAYGRNSVGLSTRASNRCSDAACDLHMKYSFLIDEAHCKDFVETVHIVKSKPAGATEVKDYDDSLFYAIKGNDMFLYVPDAIPDEGHLPRGFSSISLGNKFGEYLRIHEKERREEMLAKKKPRME